MSTIEQRAMAWMMGGDTGASSKTIARHMLGLPHTSPFGVSAPSDNWDLGRCLRLLALIPEWEERLPEMASFGAVWAALIERWAELVRRCRYRDQAAARDRRREPAAHARGRDRAAEGYRGEGAVRQAGPKWRVWIGEFVIGIWWRPEPGRFATYRTVTGGKRWICGIGFGRWDLIVSGAGLL